METAGRLAWRRWRPRWRWRHRQRWRPAWPRGGPFQSQLAEGECRGQERQPHVRAEHAQGTRGAARGQSPLDKRCGERRSRGPTGDEQASRKALTALEDGRRRDLGILCVGESRHAPKAHTPSNGEECQPRQQADRRQEATCVDKGSEKEARSADTTYDHEDARHR